jgi:hypothetical protein
MQTAPQPTALTMPAIVNKVESLVSLWGGGGIVPFSSTRTTKTPR